MLCLQNTTSRLPPVSLQSLTSQMLNFIKIVSYNANKPTEEADRSTLTNPYAVADLVSQVALSDMTSKEPERFDALERAGFKTERYGSIQENILIRAGGHYMDVGASKKIADGLVRFSAYRMR